MSEIAWIQTATKKIWILEFMKIRRSHDLISYDSRHIFDVESDGKDFTIKSLRFTGIQKSKL